jgi:hypothetical protein
MKLDLIAVFLGITISGRALAQNSFMAPVTDVTAETMPQYVAFQLSGNPCGQYFTFRSSNTQANRAVYVMLLEAAASGGSVWVQFDGACVVSAVHGVPVPPQETSDRGRLLKRAARRAVELLLFGL